MEMQCEKPTADFFCSVASIEQKRENGKVWSKKLFEEKWKVLTQLEIQEELFQVNSARHSLHNKKARSARESLRSTLNSSLKAFWDNFGYELVWTIVSDRVKKKPRDCREIVCFELKENKE